MCHRHVKSEFLAHCFDAIRKKTRYASFMTKLMIIFMIMLLCYRLTYGGDNFVRWSGDAQNIAQRQGIVSVSIKLMCATDSAWWNVLHQMLNNFICSKKVAFERVPHIPLKIAHRTGEPPIGVNASCVTWHTQYFDWIYSNKLAISHNIMFIPWPDPMSVGAVFSLQHQPEKCSSPFLYFHFKGPICKLITRLL